MRILVAEDDPKIGAFVARGLRQEGHVVDWVDDGEEALARIAVVRPDAIVLDLMLPGRDGLSVIEALRGQGDDTPILVLSARVEVRDRVRGLEVGADDYLTKPFSFAELVARLNALLRRATKSADGALRLSYGGVTLDIATRKVERDGQPIDLQPKEFALLELLLRNAERAVSKTMILEHVWEYSFDPQTNVVDVLVSRLRKKVDRAFPTRLIHTLRGVGYVLRAD